MTNRFAALPLIYLVRHGETDWNAERRLQGQADTDINEKGRLQADRNGARLAGLIRDAADFDFVASPLRRTRETMERVRLAIGLPRDGYATDPRLVEVHFGDWQGRTLPELEAAQSGSVEARERDKWNFRPPGGAAESYDGLSDRALPFFETLVRPTICVTHGGVIRCVLRQVQQMDDQAAANIDIPQDRILRVENGRAEWL